MPRSLIRRAAVRAVEQLEARRLLSVTPQNGVPTGESDFGDAPDTYGTLLASGGPVHEVDFSSIRLGPSIDIEADGLPSVNALGDDADNGDDEDGVSLPNQVSPGDTFNITLAVANRGGNVAGWIDFDRDGKFGSGEQVISGTAPAGLNTYAVTVPANAVTGDTYARFRASISAIPGPNGIGGKGEVEDYRLRIQNDSTPGDGVDFGDAPESYGTLLADDGPRHQFDARVVLGDDWDGETDGQPSKDADGDDVSPSSVDDEDGVVFGGDFVRGQDTDALVTVSGDGFLTAWFDWNRDGTFDQTTEVAFQRQVREGGNEIEIDVPADADLGETFARFRFSNNLVDRPTGPGGFGEVEDYKVQINDVPPPPDRDFGDAPASYGTLLADDGPRHDVITGFALGTAATDVESDGVPSGFATGDDITGTNDEDGLELQRLAPGLTNAFRVNLTNSVGRADPRLNAWVDFDANGTFDADERVTTDEPITAGLNALPLDVPADAVVGDTFLRLRLTDGPLASGLPTGLAGIGEVEDHRAFIAPTTPTGPSPIVVTPTGYTFGGEAGVRIVGQTGVQNVVSILRSTSNPEFVSIVNATQSTNRFWLWNATHSDFVPDLGADALDRLRVSNNFSDATPDPSPAMVIQLPDEQLQVEAVRGLARYDAGLLVEQWLSGSGLHPTLSASGATAIFAELFVNPSNPLPAQFLPRLNGLDIGTFGFVSLEGPSDQPWLLASDAPLSIGNGELQIENQTLVVRDTNGPALGLVADEVASAYSGGSWNGRGITSSLAGGSTSIGYGNPADVQLDDDLALFAAPLDDVFVGLTVAGDANLDRTVDLADFGQLRAGFGGTGPWTNGDFNYDDSVDLADFGLLRGSFGATYTPPYALPLLADDDEDPAGTPLPA